MPIPSNVVFLSSPGFGHLVPMIELAKRLATHHAPALNVTVFVVSTDSSSHLLNSAAAYRLFQVIILPCPTVTFPPDTVILTRLASMVHASLPSLRAAVATMSPRPTAMVVDLFGTEAWKVADEFDMLKYVFFPSNAWFLALTVFYPHLGTISPVEPLEMPGCDPIPAHSLLQGILDDPDAETEGEREFKRVGIEISTADGVLVNTWEDLERRTLGSFQAGGLMKPVVKAPVHAIGPLVRRTSGSGSRAEVMDWLSKRPAGSVLYVSLGTGGTLTTEQTLEMAWGLERSQQRFVWVVRTPIDYDASATLYLDHRPAGDDNQDAIWRYLPEGFLDRTREVGMVVPTWAPQEEILVHPAVGCFLSHCGWNSVLESLASGVPLIGWPLYAEQDLNATMLASHLRVAVRPSARPSKEMVGREEIEGMIRKIMVEEEGVQVRLRTKEVQRRGENALNKGGTSYEALSRFVVECQKTPASHEHI